jgi:hypothetical protein
MKASTRMLGTEPRLVWIQQAPEPGGVYFAECGPYSFENNRMPDNTGYVLQMWQLRPEDGPLVVWEMTGTAWRRRKGELNAWPTSTCRSSFRAKQP